MISAVICAVGAPAAAEPNHVVTGIGGGAFYIEDRWDVVMTVRLSLVRDGSPLGRCGVTAAGSRYTERDGGRGSAELFWMPDRESDLGLAVGALLEVGDHHHPRIGGTAAIWLHEGVVPYLRVGVLESAGGFFEAGLEIPIPVLHF